MSDGHDKLREHELEKRVEKLEFRLNMLEAERQGIKVKPEPPFVDDGSYVPPKGETAYCVNGYGHVFPHTATYASGFAVMGLSFKHEENAIRKRDQMLAQAKLRRLAREHDPEWVTDWSDVGQSKYYPYWNHYSAEVCVGITRGINYSDIIYCSENTARWLIENHHGLCKQALGVWEGE